MRTKCAKSYRSYRTLGQRWVRDDGHGDRGASVDLAGPEVGDGDRRERVDRRSGDRPLKMPQIGHSIGSQPQNEHPP